MMSPDTYKSLEEAQARLTARLEWVNTARQARDTAVLEAVKAGAWSTEIEYVTGLSRSGVDEIKRRARRTGRV